MSLDNITTLKRRLTEITEIETKKNTRNVCFEEETLANTEVTKHKQKLTLHP